MNQPNAINQENIESITDFFAAEIRSIITDDNEDFLFANAAVIPQVLARFHWRIRRLSPARLMRLYGELVFELALCESELGHYRDPGILQICLGLRLQRRLNEFLSPKPPEVEAPAPTTPKKPVNKTNGRKPKFRPARCVA